MSIYPWKTKIPKRTNVKKVVVPDWKVKTLEKKYQRPYFSQEFNSWEMDLMEVKHSYYLLIININTRYLVCYPVSGRSSEKIIPLLVNFLRRFKCDFLRGDGESAFSSDVMDIFLSSYSVGKTYFPKSPYINKNRIIDRAIRTIRDGFGVNPELINDADAMQRMVKLYNYTPHKAYGNIFTPTEVQHDVELEGMYIRAQQDRLNKVLLLQQRDKYMKYKPGNILYAYFDESKTGKKFDKARRKFDKLVQFHKYSHGNVVCLLYTPFGINTRSYFTIPIHHTKFAYGSYKKIPQSVKSYFNVK